MIELDDEDLELIEVDVYQLTDDALRDHAVALQNQLRDALEGRESARGVLDTIRRLLGLTLYPRVPLTDAVREFAREAGRLKNLCPTSTRVCRWCGGPVVHETRTIPVLDVLPLCERCLRKPRGDHGA